MTLIPQVRDSIARFELRDTGISSSPFAISLTEPIFSNLPPVVFLPSPPSQELIPITRDDELLYVLPKCPSPPSPLPDLPPVVDFSLKRILSDLSPKEKLERYHQDLAADEYMYESTINGETRVTEHDNPVSMLSRSGKLHSLCKDNTETVLLEKYEVRQLCWKLSTPSLKVYHVSTNPPARDKVEKLSIPKIDVMKNTSKISRPELLLKDENTANEDILKLSEINLVNNGKTRMMNDCDHKCPKAVGFSYPWVVLHCSEFESEKKKIKYDVKHECIDEVASVESMKEVERKLWLTHYNILSEKLTEVVRETCTGCQTDEANLLGHELCMLASVEEQVNLCFEGAYC